MKIAVIGTGYVGLPTGACFADLGNEVICVDKDVNKINSLQNGKITIYEPDLADIVLKNYNTKSLTFTTNLTEAVNNSEIIIIAVGTLTCEETGHADLSHIEEAAKDLAEILKNNNDYKVIIIKSTVSVGTNRRLRSIIREIAPQANFDIVSTPEFLREGKAIYDFFNPERIIIGSDSKRSEEVVSKLYEPFLHKGTPSVFCSFESAEIIKYASNSFLGVKVSFVNELADLCEILNADIKDVVKGLGLDSRIGTSFLNPGPGFGGSCLPKDMLEIITTANKYNSPLSIVEAAVNYNIKRATILVKKVEKVLGNLHGKQIGVLGLSFKAETDDIRKSPTINIIEKLVQKGAVVKAFDPKAIENTKSILPNILYGKDMYDVADGSDALLILTEWKDFLNLDFTKLKKIMKKRIIIDFRNLFNPSEVYKTGFSYIAMARNS